METSAVDKIASPEDSADSTVLTVDSLTVEFSVGGQWRRAVDDLSFSVHKEESVGIIGESGCGKTVTGLSIMRLLEEPPARTSSGSIWFEGADLVQASERELRALRGRRMSLIFQDPMSSLNPVFTVGDQISEVARLHLGIAKKPAWKRAEELLGMVGIPAPARNARRYPHELSGGMRQRVMIAMALVCEPSLLIADEPTTALDSTVQLQILDLLKDMQRQFHLSLILVSHDLGVVQEAADRVITMYSGQLVESGTVDQIMSGSVHPYTTALMQSNPHHLGTQPKTQLASIPGTVPAVGEAIAGCRFGPRCGFVDERCTAEPVRIAQLEESRLVRCVRHEQFLPGNAND